MMTDEDGNAHLRNLSMHRANTEEEALNLLFLGDTNRAIAETPMNMASSRSGLSGPLFVRPPAPCNLSLFSSDFHSSNLHNYQ